MQNTNQPRIAAIVAMSENRVIGKNGQLPWHLPADLKHFKALTTGHPIIMGRKTYQSIGKPLPNRTNIIITRDPVFSAAGCLVVTSIEQAFLQASVVDEKIIFIIGGAEVYRQFIPRIECIYLTIVQHAFAGDVYFPELNKNEWQETERVNHPADTENPYAYSFLLLERRNCE